MTREDGALGHCAAVEWLPAAAGQTRAEGKKVDQPFEMK